MGGCAMIAQSFVNLSAGSRARLSGIVASITILLVILFGAPIIDFKESRITDMSAIDALNKLTERYAKAGKKLQLRHLSPDCRTLIKNAESIIDVNVIEDPEYKVATD